MFISKLAQWSNKDTYGWAKSSSSAHLHSVKQTVLKEHPASCCKVKVKGKVVPVHTMQAYSRSRSTTTNIHNNSNEQSEWIPAQPGHFTHRRKPWYPLTGWLSGPQR